MALTRKWFEVKIFSWLCVWSENFHFKSFSDSRVKRERERERESLAFKPSSSPTTTDRAPIRRPTLHRSRRSQHRTDQAKIDSKAARSHLRCAISPSHPLRDLASRSNPVASLSSFFSQFDRIWWIFFSRFCFFCVSVLTGFDEFFF